MIPTFPNPHSPGCFWHDWANLFGSSENALCEAITCSVISHPANTWSNLPYFFMALYLWKLDRKFSLFIFFLASVSFLSHASAVYPTLLLDLGTSFALIGWAAAKNLRIKRFGLFIFLSGLFAVVTCHFLMLSGNKFGFIYPIGASAVMSLEWRNRHRWKKDIHIAIGFLIFAFIFAGLDGREGFCRPDSWFQGHSFWHIFTALSLPFLERHFRDLKTQPFST